MFLKILVSVVVISLLWMVFFRTGRDATGSETVKRVRKSVRPRPKLVKDLVKCPRCGIYLPSDRTCDCHEGD